MGDVSGYEIRTVRTQDGIPFWEKDRLDEGRVLVGAKVLDTKYYTKVAVYGWVVLKEDMFVENLRDDMSNCWRYPLTWLTPFPFPDHHRSFVSEGESE